jgi:hydrogenase maturation protease
LARHFIHRPAGFVDPATLHDERRFLDTGYATLHVMERQRDHLAHDIAEARSLARKAGIALPPDVGPAEERLVLIGIGDRLRRDDAAGLEVARRLRLAHPPGVAVMEEGELASLLQAWSGADEALVVDAVNSGAEPGTVHRFEVGEQPLQAGPFRHSTHELGLAEAVERARELDLLPRRLVVYGIEGESFEEGEGLTPVVQRAVAQLVMELYRELEGES